MTRDGHSPRIIGIGVVGPSRHDDLRGNYLRIAADALVLAARDAGLTRPQIDGIVVNSGGDAGPDYDQLAAYVGLELKTSVELWAHGRFTGTALHQASMMIKDGGASVVACIYARRLATDRVGGPGWKGWHEELRPGGGPHGEHPELGFTAPVGPAALAAQAYLDMFGANREALYDVVAASRTYSQHYKGALRPKPVTREQYEANDYVVAPLRRWDCTPRTEGAVCVLVAQPNTSATPGREVDIAAFTGIPKHRDEAFHWWPQTHPKKDDAIFERVGVDRSDVDVFFTYDAWSTQVWYGLERHGYAEPGQAAALIGELGIGLGGGFPVNPHGGSLSTGQLAGWLHIAEAVVQLRHEAKERQVPGASVAHYGPTLGDAMILTRR